MHMANHENPQNLIAFLRSLRAVRQFRAEPVPEEVIKSVLEVARWSGSAGNTQPWDLIVIRNRETLKALASVEGHAGHLAGASVGIVLAMVREPGRDDLATFDEGRLSERIMLAAAAYGVGSSIGWFTGGGQAAAKKLLGIPEERVVRTAISLGYPDEEARRARPKRAQARKPLSDFVHEERYS
jgi:nitroreductase